MFKMKIIMIAVIASSWFIVSHSNVEDLVQLKREEKLKEAIDSANLNAIKELIQEKVDFDPFKYAITALDKTDREAELLKSIEFILNTKKFYIDNSVLELIATIENPQLRYEVLAIIKKYLLNTSETDMQNIIDEAVKYDDDLVIKLLILLKKINYQNVFEVLKKAKKYYEYRDIKKVGKVLWRFIRLRSGEHFAKGGLQVWNPEGRDDMGSRIPIEIMENVIHSSFEE